MYSIQSDGLITLSSGSAAKAGGSGATTLEAQLSSTYLVGTLHAEKTVAEPTSAELTSVVSRARGGLQLYKSARTSTSGLNWTELDRTERCSGRHAAVQTACQRLSTDPPRPRTHDHRTRSRVPGLDS